MKPSGAIFDGYEAPPCTCGRHPDGLDCRPFCARATWLEEHTCEYCHALPAYCKCPGAEEERLRAYRGDRMRDHQSDYGEFDA